MGQQQLLLVILVTIIVGIATVVAINTFGSAADQANIDAARQDLASIASSAQGFYMKPEMLGGGSRSFEGLTFAGISVPGNIQDPTTSLIITNENGTYVLTEPSAGDQTVTVKAYASSQQDGAYVATDADASTLSLTATIEPNMLDIDAETPDE